MWTCIRIALLAFSATWILPWGGLRAGMPGRDASADGLDGAGVDGDGRAVDRLLVFSTDARSIGAGSGFVALHDLFFGVATLGIAGPLSLSAGVSAAPGLDRQLFVFAPRVTLFERDGLSVAAGATTVASRGGGATGIAGAILTAGGSQGSGTFGLGWGFGVDGFAGRPVLLAAFVAPVAGNSAIVSENWFPPGFDPSALSVAWRHSAGRIVVDLGAVFIRGSARAPGPPALPWISIVFGF